jgi:hypothetical protein
MWKRIKHFFFGHDFYVVETRHHETIMHDKTQQNQSGQWILKICDCGYCEGEVKPLPPRRLENGSAFAHRLYI